MCLPSDALLQHLPSYLGFSYLGRGVSLQGCSSKAQPLLLTLDEGYLLTAALPDLQRGIAPLGPPVPVQPLLLGRGVAPPGHCLWPQKCGGHQQMVNTEIRLIILLLIYYYLEISSQIIIASISFLNFIYLFNRRIITLQYCDGFGHIST